MHVQERDDRYLPAVPFRIGTIPSVGPIGRFTDNVRIQSYRTFLRYFKKSLSVLRIMVVFFLSSVLL